MYWNETVCGNAEINRIVPGMDSKKIRLWKESGRLERRRAPAGPKSLFLAVEVAQLMFETGLCQFGLSQTVSHNIWKAAGFGILARRFDVPRFTALLPIMLAIWRQPDGSYAVTPAGNDGRVSDDLWVRMKQAEAAGRPIVTIKADGLFDTVDYRIRLNFPECDAVQGPAALRDMRAAAAAVH